MKSEKTKAFEAPHCRAPGNYDPDEVSNANGLECKDPSKAIQSAKEETDINTIMKRFGVTGQLPQATRMPQYGDFTYGGDFREALEQVTMAQDAFMRVPAELRARLNNDPAEFIDYCLNPENLDEMRRLGLAPKPIRETPPEAQVSKEVKTETPGK